MMRLLESIQNLKLDDYVDPATETSELQDALQKGENIEFVDLCMKTYLEDNFKFCTYVENLPNVTNAIKFTKLFRSATSAHRTQMLGFLRETGSFGNLLVASEDKVLLFEQISHTEEGEQTVKRLTKIIHSTSYELIRVRFDAQTEWRQVLTTALLFLKDTVACHFLQFCRSGSAEKTDRFNNLVYNADSNVDQFRPKKGFSRQELNDVLNAVADKIDLVIRSRNGFSFIFFI